MNKNRRKTEKEGSGRHGRRRKRKYGLRQWVELRIFKGKVRETSAYRMSSSMRKNNIRKVDETGEDEVQVDRKNRRIAAKPTLVKLFKEKME